MIDMSEYFTHKDYSSTVDNFEASFNETQLNCNDYWSVFTILQRKISNNKCPICEVELSESPNKTNTATLDHFRPKADDKYPYLKCDPKNYILMCSLCNSIYKKDEFPLVDESKRATVYEEPLLFNPTEEDPLNFFELAFRQTQAGGILELKRKSDIPKDSYQYKRCEAMIKLFGLGYCHKSIHPNDNPNEEVKECRIDILTKHYNTFIELAKEVEKATKTKNRKSLSLFFKDTNRIKELKEYGFYYFIMKKKKQFSIK